ncbi:lipoyl(octanoyl) transferase LipB [Neptuniibacter pectenicola]|uniref:lipoyl(octanoyl) transferase LipB n=1 Tax=Neptuniibacter pectenicola TaxID=1806669 RepID=UPI00082CF5F1|nr:lipoyl(octanoyl) transferase LipB [Neptuniibacter pectenicola]
MLSDQLIVRDLGLLPYEPTWLRMQAFTNERDADAVDEIWSLQHEPVFTQGQAGKQEHLLNPGDIPVVQVDRGGQVTYHGPGQAIVYLMLNLKRKKVGVRELVTIMEDAVVNTLNDFQVKAYAKPDAPGVYVDDRKIASLGLRVRRGCSFHGLALNLAMDLEPFLRINPCGYAGMEMTQLGMLVEGLDQAQASQCLLNHLISKLGYSEVTRKTTLD